jgi:hypothetical protein
MGNDYKTDSTDGRIERAKDNALGKHDDHPGVADHIGEAAGGISGVTAGAAIGSVAGPIGTVIGGIAGALGGWWAGRAVAEAATTLSTDDDTHYRSHYETAPIADRNYDSVRPAYQVGHIAALNPDYRSRSFTDVEPDLRRGWAHESAYGSWDSVRGYAREGYTRGASTLKSAGNRVANAADDLKDRVDGNPASRPGPDATDSPNRY